MNTNAPTTMEEKYIRSSLKMLKHLESHPSTKSSELYYYQAIINLMREDQFTQNKTKSSEDSFSSILIYLTSLFNTKDSVSDYKEYQHLSQTERNILLQEVGPLIAEWN